MFPCLRFQLGDVIFGFKNSCNIDCSAVQLAYAVREPCIFKRDEILELPSICGQLTDRTENEPTKNQPTVSFNSITDKTNNFDNVFFVVAEDQSLPSYAAVLHRLHGNDDISGRG